MPTAPAGRVGARLWPQLLCPQLGGHGHGGEEVPHRFQHQPTQHEGTSPPHRAQPAGAGPREGPGDPVHQPRGAPPSPSGKGQRPRASAGAVVGGRGTGQTGFGLPPADWPSLRVHSVWGQRRSAGRGWSEAGELRPHGGFPWKKAGLPFVNVAVFPYCWETATSGIPGALRAPHIPPDALGALTPLQTFRCPRAFPSKSTWQWLPALSVTPAQMVQIPGERGGGTPCPSVPHSETPVPQAAEVLGPSFPTCRLSTKAQGPPSPALGPSQGQRPKFPHVDSVTPRSAGLRGWGSRWDGRMAWGCLGPHPSAFPQHLGRSVAGRQGLG